MAWFTQGSEEYGEHGEMLLQFFLDDEENDDRVVVRISELVRCLKHFRESVLSNDEHDYEYEMAGNLWAAPLEGGTLTAEQVREAVMLADRWEKPMGDTGLTNTHLIIRDDGWQAIADELNGELGGTCELVETDSYSNPWEFMHVLECSACGETCEHVNGSYPRCPHCGAKAVER